MNLLKETLEIIKRSDHNISDIIFIGSESGYICSWEEFKIMADKEYDKGFSGLKVALDLIIVFSDGQKMWRDEYDGSEKWEYSTIFQKPQELLPITQLFIQRDRDESLSEIHNCPSTDPES